MSKYQDYRHLPVIILNREIEDMGLTPYEYRIYCRVVRRAGRGNDGKDHKCFESVENIATACKVSPGTVKRSLRRLVEMRMLTRHSIPGQPSEYRLTDPDLWIPSHETTQVTTDPGGGSETTQGVVTTDPGGGSETTQGVDQRRPTKNKPTKKNPLSNNPLRSFSLSDLVAERAQADEPEITTDLPPSETPTPQNPVALPSQSNDSAAQQQTPDRANVPPPAADFFTVNQQAKEIQIELTGLSGNDWNEAALKKWAALWERSGRTPGDDWINLKRYIRKRLNPGSPDYQSFLDEYFYVKKSLGETAEQGAEEMPDWKKKFLGVA